MATLRLSTAARNAAAEAVTGLLDAGSGAGKIQLRSGSMPATPATAATGTLLATVVLQDPQSGAASAGTDTISNPASVVGVAAGDIGWARFLDSDNNVVMDCDVTVSGGGGSITVSTLTVSVGVNVDLDAITYTQPQG